MQTPVKIKVIIGSTRENRFSEKPAAWVFEEIKKKENVAAELLDLRDYPLPFFNEPTSPSMLKGNYANEIAKKWAGKIKDGDAFIFVTPEYNHGYPAVLKNALDWIYDEWNNKPVAFVSYGSVSGARSIEQLREVVVELQMAPIRNAVSIPIDVYVSIMKEKTPVNPELFKPVKEKLDGMVAQLMWWARALKTARETQTG